MAWSRESTKRAFSYWRARGYDAMQAMRYARAEAYRYACEEDSDDDGYLDGAIRFRWEDDFDADLSWDETGEVTLALESGRYLSCGLVLQVFRAKSSPCPCCNRFDAEDWETVDSLWGIIGSHDHTFRKEHETEMLSNYLRTKGR